MVAPETWELIRTTRITPYSRRQYLEHEHGRFPPYEVHLVFLCRTAYWYCESCHIWHRWQFDNPINTDEKHMRDEILEELDTGPLERIYRMYSVL